MTTKTNETTQTTQTTQITQTADFGPVLTRAADAETTRDPAV
ncbi:hypothetical protein [Streptomyces sp. LARHCF252]